MSRRKNNLNRNLIRILIAMIVILLVLIASVYMGKKLEKDKSGNEDSTIIAGSESDKNVTDNSNLTSNNDSSQDKTSSNKSNNPPSIDDMDEQEEPSSPLTPSPTQAPAEPIILAFAGDVNFDENSKPVARYDRENKGILGGISQELVDELNQADIIMLNTEFAYSTRGNRIIEKSYTFRAHPDRVDILKEMGVDIVSLANNHALDYGQDALLDTFTTLEEAGIDYVGAGHNMDRAKSPVYYTIGDTKIGYVAASRVVYAMDWYATDDRPGMIGTYDPALFISSIEEAKKNSDFVVAYVHWGVERSHEPVDYQKNMAKKYIDAGADLVIGCHPHVMQGIEFYKGKAIAYSLGNYWFNSSKRESGLIKFYINPDGTTDVQLLPVMNDNTYTYLITDESDRKAYFKFMEDISFDVKFDEDGFVTEK